MKKTIQGIIKIIEKNTLIIIIALIASIISSVFIIYNGISSASNFYYSNIQWRQRSYELINSLSADVNIGYFESRLGKADFINSAERTKKKEFIFVNDNYYIDAITDNDDKVLMYSVTTRSKNFNPSSPDGKVILGKSRFLDLNNDDFFGEPSEIISYLGVHDAFYTEGYYWGNPMNYQYYYYSYTAAGFVDYDNNYVPNPEYIPSYIKTDYPKKQESDYRKSSEIMEFRKKNTNIINTFTVTAPFITIKDMADYFEERGGFYFLGPDKNQVRLVP